MRNYFNLINLGFCLLLCATQASNAQTIENEIIQWNNEDFVVSKNIDPSFLGIYNLHLPEQELQYQLIIDEDKTSYQWGAILDNKGDFIKTDVMEYAGGKMISYSAYTILYKDMVSGKVSEWLLYEFDGKKYLDQAIKIEAVAENR